MHSPFTQMASALKRHAPEPRRAGADPTSKAGRLRQSLRVDGPACGRELAERCEVPSNVVQPLLKSDMACGRVLKIDGIYSMNPRFDDDLADQLHRAAGLLRRNGYSVKPPKEPPQHG